LSGTNRCGSAPEIRYFEDKNNNRKLDGKEQLSGEMNHTTPDNEAATARGQSY
jgi:hypothetical protein